MRHLPGMLALDLAGFTGIDGQGDGVLAPQPPVLAIRIDEGRPVVTVLGTPGSAIQLQAADRLAEAVWSPLAGFLLLSAQVEVIDEDSPGLAERYYRALVVP